MEFSESQPIEDESMLDSTVSSFGNDETGSQSGAPTIRPIEKNVIHRICSGQVVVTLATAVKELVENSIDAHATTIDIHLIESGSVEITVIDNGIGVDESNFIALTQKHCTSKLNEFEELTSIGTLGFRGEALSSLCALASLSVITKSQQSSTAYRIEYDSNGRIVSQRSCARCVGTTVVLKNLFHSLPVRHKEFIKNLKREFCKLVNILYGYCLISKGVRISCTNQERKGENPKQIVCVSPSELLKERVISLFGVKEMSSLIEMTDDAIPGDIPELILQEYGLNQNNFAMQPFKLEGFLSKPYSGRTTTDRQFLFINSRPFESQKILKIINEVYHGFSSRNRYPFVCLNIKTYQHNVDVNVSPDKRSIYLQNEKLLLSIIKATLLSLYSSTSSDLIARNSESSESSIPMDTSPPHSQSSSSQNLSQQSGSTNLSSLSRFSVCSSDFANDFSTRKNSVQSENHKTTFAPQYSGDSRKRTAESILTKFRYGVTGNGCDDLSSNKTKELSSSRIGNDLTRFRKAKQPKLFDFIASQKISKHTKLSHSTTSNTTITIDSDDNEEIIVIPSNNESEQSNSQDGSSATKSEYFFGGDSPGFAVKSSTVENQNETDNIGTLENNTNSPPLSPVLSFSQSSNADSEFAQTEVHDNSEESTIIIYDDELDEVCGQRESSEINNSITKLDIKVNLDLERLRENLSQKCKVALSRKSKFLERVRRFRAKIMPGDNKVAEEELKKELKQSMFSEMKVLGQFNLGFIIARHDSDLFIIDQHASDEKHNFENLEKTLVLQNQKLICPMSLELPAMSENVLIDNLDVFRKNGFDFEINETNKPTNRIKLTRIPFSKSYEFGREDIEELIFMMEDAPEKSFCRPTKVRTMLASRACRKSVMIGTALSKKEMIEILQHMALLNQPFNCPHGRPTIRYLFNLNLMPDSVTEQFNH